MAQKTIARDSTPIDLETDRAIRKRSRHLLAIRVLGDPRHIPRFGRWARSIAYRDFGRWLSVRGAAPFGQQENQQSYRIRHHDHS